MCVCVGVLRGSKPILFARYALIGQGAGTVGTDLALIGEAPDSCSHLHGKDDQQEEEELGRQEAQRQRWSSDKWARAVPKHTHKHTHTHTPDSPTFGLTGTHTHKHAHTHTHKALN